MFIMFIIIIIIIIIIFRIADVYVLYMLFILVYVNFKGAFACTCDYHLLAFVEIKRQKSTSFKIPLRYASRFACFSQVKLVKESTRFHLS